MPTPKTEPLKKKTVARMEAEIAGILSLKDLNQYVIDVKEFMELLSEKERAQVVKIIKAKRAEVPHIERVKVTEHVRHTLTPPELAEISLDMAQAHIDVEQAEGDKKASSAKFDGEIKMAKLIVSQRARTFRDGYDMRYVECEKIKDFDAKTITIVRKDTSEVIKKRSMTVDEMQMSLPIDLV